MQRILILLFIVAVGIGVFLLISQDDSNDTASELPDEPTKGAAEDPGSGLKGATGVGPTTNPRLLELTKPARMVVIGNQQSSWAMLMISTAQYMKKLDYRVWWIEDASTRTGKAGDGRGMAELKAAPSGQYLVDQDVDILVLDTLDPNALPESFWKVVAERVQSGRMGLYFRPSYFVGSGGEGTSEHPALSHPTLSSLLPVKRAALIEGNPLPGVFAEGKSLQVTQDGKEHPASRYVAHPEASARTWEAAQTGEHAFETKFVYPVLDVKPGHEILVEVEAATPVPAIIATSVGANKPRVVWMGNTDFGQRAYHSKSKDALMKMLVNHWFVWLAGQVEDE